PGFIESLDVTWHCGYIASYMHKSASATVMSGQSNYSYSDVITIPYAGTKITFVDNNAGSATSGFASQNAYIFSLWEKNGSSWELDGSKMGFCGIGDIGNGSFTATVEDTKTTYTYVTNSDNENIRLCYHSGETSSTAPTARPTVTMEYSGEESTYSKFVKANQSVYTYLEESKKTVYHDALEGLTLNMLGDSYFDGQGLDRYQVWGGLLAQKYGMNFVNRGIGGSTMSNYVTNKNPMVNRYSAMPDNNPDIVILEGGRNDFNQAVPIGNNSDTATTTFKGALNTLIDGLHRKYPDALIICVTPWYYLQTKAETGYTHLQYGEAMRELCALRGVPCFNAMDRTETKVDMSSSAFRTQYSITPNDGSHLNLEGMKLVMPAFEKFIEAEWAMFDGSMEINAIPSAGTVVTPDPTPIVGNTLSVNWNFGYVGSSTNGQNYVNKINPNGNYYSYSDIIVIEKAGTTITFTDNNADDLTSPSFASAAAYVISHWKQEGGDWVIDTSKAQCAGAGNNSSGSVITVNSTGATGTATYTYTTTSDNECIRLCYRSGQTATATPTSYAAVTVTLPTA
ncbi:MAG: SGNH/GDSL hydrolase family protein, partial [Clostridia bacterium]|nr:SGNH/GDSL hydrolase family protein [Clostridia bacterium]